MGRKNRYAGILQPRPVGKGSREVSLVLVYDIENDRIRNRISEICLDYGLKRIQYSAFFGKLNRNRRQELALRIQDEIGPERARVQIFPLCEDDLREMWIFEQYGQPEETRDAVDRPKLKVLSVKEFEV